MTANQLLKAALDRKQVLGFHVDSNIRMPAAFVQNMQFVLVAKRLPHMKIYKPKRNK